MNTLPFNEKEAKQFTAGKKFGGWFIGMGIFFSILGLVASIVMFTVPKVITVPLRSQFDEAHSHLIDQLDQLNPTTNLEKQLVEANEDLLDVIFQSVQMTVFFSVVMAALYILFLGLIMLVAGKQVGGLIRLIEKMQDAGK